MPYLTKSKFKLGSECPRKLYYNGRAEYANTSKDDSFLAMLAKGGFQVGELARQYFPDGIRVETPNDEVACDVTAEYLTRERVTLFEAAVRFADCLVRCDILVKDGDRLEIIEVKAKSFDPTKDSFTGKNGEVTSKWNDYIEDVAFQRLVVAGAFPDLDVRASLMLADKSTQCPTDGLHRKFRVRKEGNRLVTTIVEPVTDEDLDPSILTVVPVDAECDLVSTDEFRERIASLSEIVTNDLKPDIAIGSKCAKCEFRNTAETLAAGKLSGFEECWNEALGWTPAECAEPTVLDVWDYRQKDQRIAERVIRMRDLEERHIGIKPADKPGMSRTERQWLQILKNRNGDWEAELTKDVLRREMDAWQFPLHFIDFETAMPAVPITRGMRPYETIAFQFSHHVVDEKGSVRHASEFIDIDPGTFPNFEFVRRLRDAVGDSGSVFRYAAHENTVLAQILEQLTYSAETDRDDLIWFIRSLTNSTDSSSEKWSGERAMIDMLDIVKRCYYHPRMGGSNSIKYVLPSMLESSEYLRAKYSSQVYGTEIPSLNFNGGKVWVEDDGNGGWKDPYKLLPKLLDDIPREEQELVDIDDIREGGAAMAAYYRLQYEDLSADSRSVIRDRLLKYCELDTLAMVMIYEGWREEV